MAATDITAKETIVKGVNSPNNYIRSEARLIDGAENAGLLTVETHSLFVIPKGNMLTGLKVVALAAVTSDGSATLQFKAKIGEQIGKSKIAVTKLLNRLYDIGLAKRLDNGKLLIL